MSLKLGELTILESQQQLASLPAGKLLINTVNAHSFNVAQNDELFAQALTCGDVLIPDGASIIWACSLLGAKSRPAERCAGWDLFEFEMNRLNTTGGKVMFMGSSERTLALIKQKAATLHPNLEVVTYSPPFKPEFTDEDSNAIINAINDARPDLLWIGMTAPKQEKWTYKHWDRLNINCHVGTIGAVFDFYAGNTQRAPQWAQQSGLEWLYRLVKEPRRMWRRYVLGNPLFVYNILKEKFSKP